MTSHIAIIGSGHVGAALKAGFERIGHTVRVAGRAQVAASAAWADLIVVAVPFGAVKDVAHELQAAADGKPVLDVTNAFTPDLQLAIGFSTSGAEQLQKAIPRAHVVKAFNTVLAPQMSQGAAAGQPLSLFAASDDAGARRAVLELGKALGFDPVDAGPLKNARHLEALGALNVQLAFVLGQGPDTGFRWVH